MGNQKLEIDEHKIICPIEKKKRKMTMVHNYTENKRLCSTNSLLTKHRCSEGEAVPVLLMAFVVLLVLIISRSAMNEERTGFSTLNGIFSFCWSAVTQTFRNG